MGRAVLRPVTSMADINYNFMVLLSAINDIKPAQLSPQVLQAAATQFLPSAAGITVADGRVTLADPVGDPDGVHNIVVDATTGVITVGGVPVATGLTLAKQGDDPGEFVDTVPATFDQEFLVTLVAWLNSFRAQVLAAGVLKEPG